MDDNKWEGNGRDEVVEQIAAHLDRVGVRFKVGDILKCLQKWKVSHVLELEMSDEEQLQRLGAEFDNPGVRGAFADAVYKTLGIRIENISARRVPRSLDPFIVDQVEEIMLQAEKKADTWTVLEFGKHAGATLPQIMFLDPDWFFWAFGEGVFQGRDNLATEAQEIYNRARSIRIPQAGDEKTVVEYLIHPITNDFSHFQLVPQSRLSHQGASPTIRLEVVDMGLVKEISPYDKTGYRRLVKDIKTFILGDSNVKMTKTRCEAFFSDDGNFNL